MNKKALFAALILVVFGLLFFGTAGVCFADVSAQLKQAETHRNDGNYAEAKAIYQSILTNYPGTDFAFSAQENLAILYIFWDKPAQAASIFCDNALRFYKVSLAV